MTDELENLFKDLRTRTLGEIVPPGAPQARAVVRRRRGVAVSAGAGVTVAAILIGAGFGLYPGTGGDYAVGDAPSDGPSSSDFPVMPDPTGPEYDRATAAGGLLADRDKTPTSIRATQGVVAPDYENHVNDMAADKYAFRFFCVGPGTVQVVVKQGETGNTVLGQGTATCAAQNPEPLELTIRQPKYGYLRLFAVGDAAANGQAGFAFEFLSTTGKTFGGVSGAPTLSVSSSPSGG
ncbi:hypothetical protein BJ973_003583 [Actinoplanes tereljensis]|uniref:Uncharacterized protein n=1 Tax=Paractinoplanes tereljensis TaxID=571912 RepID=A0A919NWQ1_9ACTN|nr:hypothetical protein [Actinoplanes tereljensis]GIF25304.1 hypothetical protein Ate02nite_80340 [Actinoplanes tereljensis]